MQAVGTIANPIGAVAAKQGGALGTALDPAAAVAKKAGGPDTQAGALIDPAGALRTLKKRQAALLVGAQTQPQTSRANDANVSPDTGALLGE